MGLAKYLWKRGCKGFWPWRFCPLEVLPLEILPSEVCLWRFAKWGCPGGFTNEITQIGCPLPREVVQRGCLERLPRERCPSERLQKDCSEVPQKGCPERLPGGCPEYGSVLIIHPYTNNLLNIEIINNKAMHNLIDTKCRWRSDWLDGAVSFRESLGQTKVMQIRQGETLNHQGAITHEICCLAAQFVTDSCSKNWLNYKESFKFK